MRLMGFMTLWSGLSIPHVTHAVDATQCWMVAEKLVTIIELRAEKHDGQSVKLDEVLAKPDGDGPFPAIVMLHEGTGLVIPHYCRAVLDNRTCRLAPS